VCVGWRGFPLGFFPLWGVVSFFLVLFSGLFSSLFRILVVFIVPSVVFLGGLGGCVGWCAASFVV